MNALHPGFGTTAHYDASKGAVSAYTRSLAAETGLRVNAVAPGLIKRDALVGSELEEYWKSHSVKKAMMEREEIGLAKGLEKGKTETRIEAIKNLMETMSFSAEQAMKALKIPSSDFAKYMTML